MRCLYDAHTNITPISEAVVVTYLFCSGLNFSSSLPNARGLWGHVRIKDPYQHICYINDRTLLRPRVCAFLVSLRKCKI